MVVQVSCSIQDAFLAARLCACLLLLLNGVLVDSHMLSSTSEGEQSLPIGELRKGLESEEPKDVDPVPDDSDGEEEDSDDDLYDEDDDDDDDTDSDDDDDDDEDDSDEDDDDEDDSDEDGEEEDSDDEEDDNTPPSK